MNKTPEQISEFKAMLDYYDNSFASTDQSELILVLKETQRIFGCIPNDLMPEIIRIMKTSAPIIKSLIHRFPSLLAENATHIIIMCNGERCAKKDSVELIRKVEKYLGIYVGQTTADKKFELRTQHCLHRCVTSPNMQVDQDEYANIDFDKVKGILTAYK